MNRKELTVRLRVVEDIASLGDLLRRQLSRCSLLYSALGLRTEMASRFGESEPGVVESAEKNLGLDCGPYWSLPLDYSVIRRLRTALCGVSFAQLPAHMHIVDDERVVLEGYDIATGKMFCTNSAYYPLVLDTANQLRLEVDEAVI